MLLEEQFLDRFRRALEGDRQLFLLDLTQQHLDAGGIETDEVLEGEHEGADLFRGLAVAFLEGGEEAAFGVAVEVVEDFGDHLVGVDAGWRGRGWR